VKKRIDKFLENCWKFIGNILYLLDLVLNTFLLGDPSETVSSRLGRALRSGKPKNFAVIASKIVDKVFHMGLGEKNHSVENIEHDEDYEHELWSWIKK